MFRKTALICLPLAALVVLISLSLVSSWPGNRTSTQKEIPPQEPTPSAFRQLTDLAGRSVTLPENINRFVLMRGLALYDLAALLGDQLDEKLVGWDSSLQSSDRDAYDKFVARFPGLKQIPLLGDSLRDGVSAEAVLALQPDVVIAGTYMVGQTKCLEQLEQAGVPVLYLNSDDPFRDPQKSLLLLGKVFQQEPRAREIVDWVDREFAVVQERMSGLDGPIPSIYVEAGTSGAGRYGNTFGSNLQGQRVNWGSILSQLRCQNVAKDVSGAYGMGVIQPEFLLTSNPSVIVITGACWTAHPESLRLGYDARPEPALETLRQYENRPGWSELDAIQNGRLYGLNTRLGSHVTAFAAVQQLTKWLYPREFSDLNPQQRLQEFHERFMPIEYSGTWMVELKAP
ncbi:ABC transporter substrate-binding protein [Planctomicrobium piriforme]|uniref:Iron complex transport system substrate-binding protein n=1 Tax=Planctomicrobium piriforme TaxID=1576369 RepID=A0A1I3CJS4_9PLAN|nr:ABC transporter substrate-binding protein [Planctomicrobium piriforme]SFH74854.1 iron complex transport system substrate-binding protein [Planctomicrobium piriforme]